MPLFHACTDGLRFNYAGATPAGEGLVWDGRKGAAQLDHWFVCALSLGGRRGARTGGVGENDRGWVTATNVPCQELVRRGEVLELRLNLIAKPSVIAAPRTLLIGFQATPTKPMPAGWRTWTVACGQHQGVERDFTFLGSCWYWGSLTPCADIYPMNEDFSLWEEYAKAKRTKQVNSDFMTQWGGALPRRQPPADKDYYLAHIRCGFGAAATGSTNVLVYTNGRGVRFDTREGQTFLDEWHRDAFTTRNWPPGGPWPTT